MERKRITGLILGICLSCFSFGANAILCESVTPLEFNEDGTVLNIDPVGPSAIVEAKTSLAASFIAVHCADLENSNSINANQRAIRHNVDRVDSSNALTMAVSHSIPTNSGLALGGGYSGSQLAGALGARWAYTKRLSLTGNVAFATESEPSFGIGVQWNF